MVETERGLPGSGWSSDGVTAARKTSGFLVVAQTAVLTPERCKISRCIYERQVPPWLGSFLVILRPCSSATSGSRRAMAARRSPLSAMRCSRPASRQSASTKTLPLAGTMRGDLDPRRSQELMDEMRAAGLPT